MSKTPDLNVNRTIGEVIAAQRKPNIQSETGWYNVGEEWAVGEPITVGFTNAWGNAGIFDGITHAPVGWYLAEDGEVRLRGVIDGGVAGDSVFQLPIEVRPEYAQTFICAVIGGGQANIRIDADGVVTVESIG